MPRLMATLTIRDAGPVPSTTLPGRAAKAGVRRARQRSQAEKGPAPPKPLWPDGVNSSRSSATATPMSCYCIAGRGEPLVLVSWDTWNRVARTIVSPGSPRSRISPRR
jgi:hypothetical protein